MVEEKKPGKFLEIACPRCKKIHLIFGKSSIKIKCENCKKLLVKTTGGKTKIKAPVKKII